MRTIVYYLGISLLFAHEMDAVMYTEWRLLFVLRDMTDQVAYPVFLLLHVPIFFAFFWFGQHSSLRIRSSFRGMVSLLLIAHALIHFYVSESPAYMFEGISSNMLIYAAALSGLLYLTLPYLRSSPDAA